MDMDIFFENLPKMTNNHIHIYALIPYRKLIKIIKKIDPELYDKIYVLNTNKCESHYLYKYTLTLLNELCEGISYDDVTCQEDWVKLPVLYDEFKNQLVINQHTPNPFAEFEKIQTLFRIFIRHYKVYYYLWYFSLYINYHNNIFYLNVRGKPGSISVDTKCSQRLYLQSKHILSVDSFNEKIKLLSADDKDINSSDYKYMYKQYMRMKFESDLTMKAVYDFNTNKSYPSYVSKTHLFDDDIKVLFKDRYDSKDQPQMMVQYIITLLKPPKNVELDLKSFMLQAKIMLYTAVIINDEYQFPFFNGIDFVGNEQTSHSLDKFIPVLKKLLYFRKFGISIIPHIGETNIVTEEISPAEQFILDTPITRIGHGISFITNKKILDTINILYIESCPISNYLLGYYNPQQHPHQSVINSPKIKLMICSDDNAIFNYNSVKRDYIFIYKYWNVTLPEIKRLILNGLDVIPKKYKQYYLDVFKHLWSRAKIDELPVRPQFNKNN